MANNYESYIRGHEEKFLTMDEKKRYSHAYNILHEITGMNAKKNPDIGKLADHVLLAIEQEKLVNQDIRDIKGKVSSNIGLIIEMIMHEKPDI